MAGGSGGDGSGLTEPGARHESVGYADARRATRKRLWIALGLVAGFAVAEVIGGLAANSLALLADAGHMVADAAAIGLALFAMWVAERPASARTTFGFQRTEVLAALVNAVGLWAVAAWVFFEASRRFMSPSEVEAPLMLVVGAVGLAANLGAAAALRSAASESLNVEGAFLHILGDLAGSVGVVAAGVLVLAFGWNLADPVIGALIGVLIVFSSARLLWKVLRVLMEGTPSRLDLQRLCERLEQVPQVTGVHDIHVWSISSGYEVMSTHVTASCATREERERLLAALREIATGEFGITHVTIQLEDSPEGCEEAHHIAHSGGQARR